MNTPKHIHFLGICGTGMAAAAALLKEKGHHVTGSDSGTYPPMSTYLEKESIPFTRHFEPSNVIPPPDVVVVGNAISRGNLELEEILDRKIPYVSLAELIREELIRGKQSLVVTGTHGKTTTASLLAWVLERNGRDPSFFVGGIPTNFGRGIGRGTGNHVVLEGDEYDTAFFDKRPKFLHYLPDVLIINNIEFDHADIYRDMTEVKRAFIQLQRLVPRKGLIIGNADEPVVTDVLNKSFCRVEWFGATEDAPWRVTDVEPQGNTTLFSLWHGGHCIGRFRLPLMGTHNAMNAAAVYVVCHWLGLGHEETVQGFETFRGVQRRLDHRGTYGGVVVFDDFAHHPTAIQKTLHAIQSHYAGHPIWAVFEPRTHTMRRNLLQKELAHAFEGAARVIIGGVYRGETVDQAQRLDPEELACDIERNTSAKARHMADVEAIARYLCTHVQTGEVVVLMSSGDFGGLPGKVVEGLKERA
jgi:UDP-N-acetylmuramate: L-alanyl-gamma-D-glutamyl-meso-diaminopimelate ligase